MIDVKDNPSGFTPRLRDLCADRCAEFGEPPCWRLPSLSQPCEHITPCAECIEEALGDA